MNITKEQNDKINLIRTYSIVGPDKLEEIKSIWNQLVYPKLKRYVDWSCPTCIRGAIDDLITFQKENPYNEPRIIEDNKVENNNTKKNTRNNKPL